MTSQLLILRSIIGNYCVILKTRARARACVCVWQYKSLSGICTYHSALRGYLQCDIVSWHIDCKYSGHSWQCRQISQQCVLPCSVSLHSALLEVENLCSWYNIAAYLPVYVKHTSDFSVAAFPFSSRDEKIIKIITSLIPLHPLLISKLLWHYDPLNNNLLNNPYIFYFTCL